MVERTKVEETDVAALAVEIATEVEAKAMLATEAGADDGFLNLTAGCGTLVEVKPALCRPTMSRTRLSISVNFTPPAPVFLELSYLLWAVFFRLDHVTSRRLSRVTSGFRP